jgi:hypothetical protein
MVSCENLLDVRFVILVRDVHSLCFLLDVSDVLDLYDGFEVCDMFNMSVTSLVFMMSFMSMMSVIFSMSMVCSMSIVSVTFLISMHSLMSVKLDVHVLDFRDARTSVITLKYAIINDRDVPKLYHLGNASESDSGNIETLI